MKTIAVLFILLHSVTVFAGKPESVLVAPADPPQAGQTMVFSLYLYNSRDETIHTDLRENVICSLKSADQTIAVTAQSVQSMAEGTVKIHKKSFIKVLYSLTLPTSMTGAVRMEIPAFDAAGMMFLVAPGPLLPPEAEVAETDKTKSPKFASMDSLFALYQPYLKNIAAYEPMYFLVGTDPQNSKFQISFKYRLLNSEGPLAQKYPWVKGFHFAYTQTSFWDLASASMPFEDTGYKPEFFFLSSNIHTGTTGIKRFFLQTGFQHESNGRGSEYSRSTNFYYLNPIFIFFNEKNRFGLQITPRIWTYLANDDSTNPELKDYRGYFDLGLKFGKADSFVVGSHLRWAEAGASVQVDLTYPLRRFSFKNIDLYFQAQYVNSLAESLLNYKERTEALRIGFAIVR